MSRRNAKATRSKERDTRDIERVRRVGEITEYLLPGNGLRVLYARRPGTGVVTSNILYFVGSRDEAHGETGVAHMLEHMLFKPTTHDRSAKSEAAAMRFEREFGIVLNANTWKDRTTYYFSYPKAHLERALSIEAERMRDVIMDEAEFAPERTNVLSEYDMYAGDEQFALAVDMTAAAFQSHPYGHETIGFREDIESYTPQMLRRFYERFYVPGNAVLIIVGDLIEREMKEAVLRYFKDVPPGPVPERLEVKEPKQRGRRLVEVRRESKTNVYAIGVKHGPFPTKPWYETMAVFDMLAGGRDSILHKALVDTGLVTRIDTSVEPSRSENLAILFFTLSPKASHDAVRKRMLASLASLNKKTITPYLQKTIAKAVTSEFETRENSLGYVAELVEYVSAGQWTAFFETERMLRSIRPDDVLTRVRDLFVEENTTEGRFIGTKRT
ncbi:MAG TPA: pitrilysin family protein [Candidatus Paceibacterota bacterium]|nr:pitrilysin family protein [Candidatus Paceibacterota bacterium]